MTPGEIDEFNRTVRTEVANIDDPDEFEYDSDDVVLPTHSAPQ